MSKKPQMSMQMLFFGAVADVNVDVDVDVEVEIGVDVVVDVLLILLSKMVKTNMTR